RPPSSVSNINRRPLVLAGIELRGVDRATGGSLFRAGASGRSCWGRKRQVIALRHSVAVPANTALQRFQMVVTRLQLPGD
ncbi:hypothetical protein ABQ144_07435, partial [Xanthomonas hortorum pv. hederae]